MIKNILVFTILIFPLLGFNDFADYWIIKLNGNYVYNAKNEFEHRTTQTLTFKIANLTLKDSIEIMYLQDAIGNDTPYKYFVSHSSSKETIPIDSKDNCQYLQKFLEPTTSYKLSLLDIYKIGQRTRNKSIIYYSADSTQTIELCRIEFK